MIELFVSSLITFFVVIDPPGCAPIYAGLTTGASNLQRRAMAIRAVGIATAILLPQLLSGSASTEEVSSFTDLGDVSRAESWGEVFTMATRHHEEFGDINWTWLFVLAGIGAASRRGTAEQALGHEEVGVVALAVERLLGQEKGRLRDEA